MRTYLLKNSDVSLVFVELSSGVARRKAGWIPGIFRTTTVLVVSDTTDQCGPCEYKIPSSVLLPIKFFIFI